LRLERAVTDIKGLDYTRQWPVWNVAN